MATYKAPTNFSPIKIGGFVIGYRAPNGNYFDTTGKLAKAGSSYSTIVNRAYTAQQAAPKTAAPAMPTITKQAAPTATQPTTTVAPKIAAAPVVPQQQFTATPAPVATPVTAPVTPTPTPAPTPAPVQQPQISNNLSPQAPTPVAAPAPVQTQQTGPAPAPGPTLSGTALMPVQQPQQTGVIPVPQPLYTGSLPGSAPTPVQQPAAPAAPAAQSPVTQTFNGITYSMAPTGAITVNGQTYNPGDTLYKAVSNAFGGLNYNDYVTQNQPAAAPVAPTTPVAMPNQTSMPIRSGITSLALVAAAPVTPTAMTS